MYFVRTGTRAVRTSMYSVHTRGIAMPRAIHCDVAVLCPTHQGNLQQIPYVLCMAECCTGTYSSIVQYHLVLLCSGTYYLVIRFTILANLTFRFGTWYLTSCTATSAVRYSYLVPHKLHSYQRCAACEVPRTKSKCQVC
jgi:hypothetical protein